MFITDQLNLKFFQISKNRIKKNNSLGKFRRVQTKHIKNKYLIFLNKTCIKEKIFRAIHIYDI